jgi:hypothetical protein
LHIIYKVYEERFPEALTYPVFRVDIFRRQDGRFVVNEFESLEADIHSASGNAASKLFGEVSSIMEGFWLDELFHLADF